MVHVRPSTLDGWVCVRIVGVYVVLCNSKKKRLHPMEVNKPWWVHITFSLPSSSIHWVHTHRHKTTHIWTDIKPLISLARLGFTQMWIFHLACLLKLPVDCQQDPRRNIFSTYLCTLPSFQTNLWSQLVLACGWLATSPGKCTQQPTNNRHTLHAKMHRLKSKVLDHPWFLGVICKERK